MKVEISRIKPEEEGKAKKNKKKKSRSSDDDDGKANDENDYEYSFLCNRWLAKNEDDGEIVRELVPSTKSGLKRQNTLSGNIKFFIQNNLSSQSHSSFMIISLFREHLRHSCLYW